MPASPDRRRRVGWGVVGCGWVGRDLAGPAIAASRNGRLIALCDRRPEELERVGAAHPEAARHQDLAEFLATPGLDAVYVATPNDSHAALTRAVAEAGKHVLCEKPMALDAAEAEGMVQACRRAGVTYATAFDQRFHAAHRRLARLVREGDLGRVACVRIHYACWTPRDWTPDNWRVDPRRAGGGAMIDLAPHGLDLTQYLLAEPVETVACLTQRRIFDYPVDDGAVLVARTTGGALLSHTVAYNCPDIFPRRRLELIGDRGKALALDTMGQTPGGTLTLTGLDGVERPVPVDPADDRSPFLNQVEAFADALLSGRPFPFPPELDLHTMRLLDGAAREATARVEPPAVSMIPEERRADAA